MGDAKITPSRVPESSNEIKSNQLRRCYNVYPINFKFFYVVLQMEIPTSKRAPIRRIIF